MSAATIATDERVTPQPSHSTIAERFTEPRNSLSTAARRAVKGQGPTTEALVAESLDPDFWFWQRLRVVGECWYWSRTNDGSYGVVTTGGSTQGAHRVAFMIAKGDIPAGLEVCHTCDNRPCVRPSHLFLGTAKENSDDMVRKGRWSKHPRTFWRDHPERNPSNVNPDQFRGESNARAKLTADQVRAIRSAYDAGESSISLGRRFGVHDGSIRGIVRRKTWRHIE